MSENQKDHQILSSSSFHCLSVPNASSGAYSAILWCLYCLVFCGLTGWRLGRMLSGEFVVTGCLRDDPLRLQEYGIPTLPGGYLYVAIELRMNCLLLLSRR